MIDSIRRARAAFPSLCSLALAALLLAPSPARAVERGRYSVEVLVGGRPLDEYAARGRTYVEALEGREYSIRLTNRTAERVAVALSVDGLNSIDAKTTTAAEARKWILDPWQTVTIDGWQTSGSTARRFYFTTEADSYGTWLGKTRNLGLVSAAFFREKLPRPVPIDRSWSEDDRRGAAEEKAAAAPPAARDSASGREAEAPRADAKSVAPRRSEEPAATGIGREVDHRVVRVRFDAEDAPAAVCEVRYEYRDALVRLGVLPGPRWDDPLVRRERARGFEEGEFAPDPYGR